MKKKDVMDILDEFLNIEINTPYFKSKPVNKNHIKFLNDNVMEIAMSKKGDASIINVKDITVITGRGRL